jgi:hypothetical protein
MSDIDDNSLRTDHILWINLDSLQLRRIVLEQEGEVLDMPFEDFMNILKVYFKKKVE